MHNHAFFSPTSQYNTFRSNERPEHKLYGYFWTRRQVDADSAPVTIATSAVERTAARTRPAPTTLAMGSSPIAAFRIGPDAVDELAPPSHLSRLQAQDGRVVFELRLGSLDIPDRPCRALLIHRRVLDHFRKVDERLVGLANWDVIKAVIQDRFLDGNPKIAALLSGVPDLDATIDHLGRVVFPSYTVPVGSPELDNSTYIVIVVNDQAAATDTGAQT